MNKLDDKVIVDRALAKAVLDILDANCASFSGHERAELQAALAADFTGWVAVPVVTTPEMDFAGARAREKNHMWQIPADAPFYDSISYRAMLEASPPLPGRGK